MNKPNEAIVPTPPWRFSPSVAIGTLCLIAYIAVFYGIAQASGIDYGEWFANANNAIHSALIPLVAGSLLLIAFLVWSRWNAVWRDPVRLPTNRLHATLIYLFVGTIVLRLVFINWGEVPTDLLLVVIAVGIGVGFAEEMALRGVFLRGMRTNGRSEGMSRAVDDHRIRIAAHTEHLSWHRPVRNRPTSTRWADRLCALPVPAAIRMDCAGDDCPRNMGHFGVSQQGLPVPDNEHDNACPHPTIQLLALIALVQFVRSEREPVNVTI